jgi:hypothetical protein
MAFDGSGVVAEVRKTPPRRAAAVQKSRERVKKR